MTVQELNKELDKIINLLRMHIDTVVKSEILIELHYLLTLVNRQIVDLEYKIDKTRLGKYLEIISNSNMAVSIRDKYASRVSEYETLEMTKELNELKNIASIIESLIVSIQSIMKYEQKQYE